MTVVAWVQLGPNGMGAGRPLRTGMRPNWGLDQTGPSRELYDGIVTVVGAEQIEPGASGLVEITPFKATSWQHLVVGDRVELRVGMRSFGFGEVCQIRD